MSGLILPHGGLIRKKAAAGGGWTPNDLTDSVWFDFSDTTNIWSDGARATEIVNGVDVQEIQAKGDNATLRALTQSSGTNRPTWNSSGYAAFTAANADHLYCSSTLFSSSMFSQSAVSCFFLVSIPATLTFDIVASETSSSTSNPAFLILRGSNAINSAVSFYVRNNSGNSDASSLSGSGYRDGTVNRITQIIDVTNAEVDYYLDNSKDTTDSITFPSAPGTFNTFSLGCWRPSGTPTNPITMNLYQAIFVPSEIVDGSTLDLIDDFFVDKGGL